MLAFANSVLDPFALVTTIFLSRSLVFYILFLLYFSLTLDSVWTTELDIDRQCESKLDCVGSGSEYFGVHVSNEGS